MGETVFWRGGMLLKEERVLPLVRASACRLKKDPDHLSKEGSMQAGGLSPWTEAASEQSGLQ